MHPAPSMVSDWANWVPSESSREWYALDVSIRQSISQTVMLGIIFGAFTSLHHRRRALTDEERLLPTKNFHCSDSVRLIKANNQRRVKLFAIGLNATVWLWYAGRLKIWLLKILTAALTLPPSRTLRLAVWSECLPELIRLFAYGATTNSTNGKHQKIICLMLHLQDSRWLAGWLDGLLASLQASWLIVKRLVWKHSPPMILLYFGILRFRSLTSSPRDNFKPKN